MGLLSVPSCFDGCLPSLSGARTRRSNRARARSDSDPRGWASPAPWSPSGWETWGREVSETSAAPEVTPVIDIHIEEGTMPNGQSHRRKFAEAGLVEKKQHDRRDFRLEQLLASPGSLPPHMTSQERRQSAQSLTRRVIEQLPQNASVQEKLAKVPRRLITSRGPEGQQVRRAVLRGATVVWVCAGVEGKRFVYEKAHELGVRSILIESPDSWSKKLVDEGIVSKFIGVDMSRGSEEVFRDALSALQKLQADPEVHLDGVATVVELSVPLVSRLAEAAFLPGPLPEHVDIARDKRRTRQALHKAGLPTPPNFLIQSEADLARAAEVVGFPAVLKPISGAASLGVKKVPTKASLRDTYLELQEELHSLVVISGALMKGDGTKGVGADKVIGNSAFLLERYLDGDEVDVDVVMSEGEWQYAAVSDNGPTLEPYFNETWAVSPSLLSREQQVALKELAISAVKAIGFLDGIFHVECKYTSDGPHLIEVNARMGGGPVYATNLRTWGVDLVEETILCAVGVPSRPPVPQKPLECIANSDVNALSTGVLQDLSFLEPLQGRRGVISFSPHVAVGERVVGPKDGLPTWLVEIVVVGATPRAALDLLLQLEAEVQAKVKLA
mmetsp:Transcript_22935/g.53673  ORF Transcript_22935/g.53673 Transcript_22935/m.53673 type:complete len:614 (+) Transcript_22935:70-1911(+)